MSEQHVNDLVARNQGLEALLIQQDLKHKQQLLLLQQQRWWPVTDVVAKASAEGQKDGALGDLFFL